MWQAKEVRGQVHVVEHLLGECGEGNAFRLADGKIGRTGWLEVVEPVREHS